MDLNLLAPINQLGYGIASVNILEQLVELGHVVSLFPIGHTEIGLDRHSALVKESEQRAGYYDLNVPSLKIWHQNALAEHVGFGPQFGFPFFELDKFKLNEYYHMNAVNLLVASQWAANVCEANSLKRPKVVPLGVDRTIFHEGIPYDRWASDFTTFVNVGKWEKRKGHDVLISAFNKAFDSKDKVILKLASLNPFIGQSGNDHWINLCRNSRLSNKIKVQPSRLHTQHDIARFLISSDCSVFPARAEAWNLEFLEALSCGLHCIGTNYSGHTEYADQSNSRLIDIDRMEDAMDGIWFHGDGQWAHLGRDQEDQLIEYMREVHRLKQTGDLKRNDAGIETAKRFNWRNTAHIIGEILDV